MIIHPKTAAPLRVFLKRFAKRMIAIDAPTMLMWGSITARLESADQTMSIMDSIIIASALHNNLIVATRHVPDFIPGGVQVINPWELDKRAD